MVRQGVADIAEPLQLNDIRYADLHRRSLGGASIGK